MKKSEFLDLIYEILQEKETNVITEGHDALDNGDYKELKDIGDYLTKLHEGMNFIWDLCRKTLFDEENKA